MMMLFLSGEKSHQLTRGRGGFCVDSNAVAAAMVRWCGGVVGCGLWLWVVGCCLENSGEAKRE